MKKSLITSVLILVLFLAGCGNSSKDSSGDISKKGESGAISSNETAEQSSSHSNTLVMNGENSLASGMSSNSENLGASSSRSGNFTPSASSKSPVSPISPEAGNEYVTPCIVKTQYETSDVVIADVIATNKKYGADPTGTKDSTRAIQNALNDCNYLGGGTVWLPAGKYIVSSTVTIPSYVTLRGDWQDPDKGNNYGTIILASPPSSNSDTPALFTIGGSAGVMGLTVYYPEQDINNVKPYPFTFYVSGSSIPGGYMLQSIVNCTVINGYRGIGASALTGEIHEMMTVDTVKGTFLYRGAEAYNQADVGTWKNVTIDNKYWAGAGASLKKADRTKLDSYTRQNTTGLMLGDLEWTQFSNLQINGCKVGIHLVKGKRIEFAGSLFGLTIDNCTTGLLADSMDTRWGMVAAKGKISGSSNAIVNNTSGVIKLTDVTLSGTNKGSGILKDNDSLSSVNPSYVKEPVKIASRLYVVSGDKYGKTDITSELQKTIMKASNDGGGVVYIPAGTYKMVGRVTVPAGVEIRGASSVAQRETLNKGTVILAESDVASSPDTSPALITLEGKNSGIRGLRIFFANNNFQNGVKKTGFAVRGKASGVYVINSAISAAYNGVDFRDCDQHIIRKLVGCSYNNMITAGGNAGHIEGCLQNGTAIYRNGLNIPGWPSNESEIFKKLFDPITRVQTEYIRLENASGQTIMNVFAYGVKTLVVNNNSTSVKIINVGADNIGSSSPLLHTTGGSITGVNIMRYNGRSYQNSGTDLKLYNRLTINNKAEATVKE